MITTRRLVFAVVVFLTCLSLAKSRRATLKLRSEDYMKYSQGVMAGARMGVQECDRQFKLDAWNCHLSKKNRLLPVFAKVKLPLANKETAFAHAITMAGVMYYVIRSCRLGQLENCKCQRTKKRFKEARSSSSDWHWGGCSDNVAFGDLVARNFVDALEGRKGDEHDARRYMNLHNNKVGRKIVKSTAKKVCKCHGASSSCTVKTCMKKLGSFEDVGDALKQKYNNAVRVQFKNESLYDDKNEVVTKRRITLVYFDESPDYCKANELLNIPGVEGRVCESTKDNLKQCEKLCTSCGLKAKMTVITRTIRCNCKFEWCCRVTCEECKEDVVKITCAR